MKINISRNNGGWIWFSKQNLKRFSFGWKKPIFWWAVFGFSGCFVLNHWPCSPVFWRQRERDWLKRRTI